MLNSFHIRHRRTSCNAVVVGRWMSNTVRTSGADELLTCLRSRMENCLRQMKMLQCDASPSGCVDVGGQSHAGAAVGGRRGAVMVAKHEPSIGAWGCGPRGARSFVGQMGRRAARCKRVPRDYSMKSSRTKRRDSSLERRSQRTRKTRDVGGVPCEDAMLARSSLSVVWRDGEREPRRDASAAA